MRDYTQLTQEERYQIEALLKMGHHQSEIAVVLKRHKSTISREVRRNPGSSRLPPEAGAAPGPGPPRGQGQAEDYPRNLGMG
jgi:transposase